MAGVREEQEAVLALSKVWVNRRVASLFVYDDRLVIANADGERVIAITRLERVASRRDWRGRPRLLLALDHEDLLEVRGLSASDTSVAHRTIVDVARRLH